MSKVGEIEITRDVLTKVGLNEDQFNLLEDNEKEELLAEHGYEVNKPAPKKDDDQKTAGLLKDLQNERAERQRLQAQLEQSNARGADLEEKFNELSEKLNSLGKGDVSDITVGDEEFVSGKALKGIIARETAKVEAEMKKIIQQNAVALAEAQEVRMQLSEIQVAEQYSVEKVGPELEYFNVLEKGTKLMLAENPGYKAVIARAKNPALEGYKIGLQHPDFAKLVRKKDVDEVVGKIKSPEKRPVTGAGRGGAKTGGVDAENMSVKDLMKLSDKELDEIARGAGDE